MIGFPGCKINLGLFITGKRSDNYHNIETVLYPVRLFDVLEINKSGSTGDKFQSSGLKIDGKDSDNLILKACNLLRSDYDLPPVEIILHKVIPTGAGLGGGSSDGAYTLKMINNLFSLNISTEKMKNYSKLLGSDCAFFLEEKPVIATGKGDEFDPIDLNLDKYTIVIVKPEVSISTPDAYSWIKPLKRTVQMKEIIKSPISEWKLMLVNDFEKEVFTRFPSIGMIKKKLYKEGALHASMSGSGSAIFGIFKTKADLSKVFNDCFFWQT